MAEDYCRQCVWPGDGDAAAADVDRSGDDDEADDCCLCTWQTVTAPVDRGRRCRRVRAAAVDGCLPGR